MLLLALEQQGPAQQVPVPGGSQQGQALLTRRRGEGADASVHAGPVAGTLAEEQQSLCQVGPKR